MVLPNIFSNYLHIALTGLELLGSSNPTILASKGAENIDMHSLGISALPLV